MQDQGEQVSGTGAVVDNPIVTDPIYNRCQIEVFALQQASQIAETVLDIHSRVFPQTLDKYKITDDDSPKTIKRKQRVFEVERKAKIREIIGYITNPKSCLILCKDPETGNFIGYTLAVPIGISDRKRVKESDETAYIFNTTFLPDYQGHGLVGKIMPVLESQLRGRGYSFFERDVRMDNDYHTKVEKNYLSRIVAKSGPHASWVGPQMFYRIKL